MTARATYGHFSGPGLEVPGGVPFAASQYFNSVGANFIYLDSSGYATGALNATAGLAGYFTGAGFSPDAPEVSLDANGYYEFLTSSTAATKYTAMIASYADVFYCPADAAYALAYLGQTADLVGSASNASASRLQVDFGTTSTDVLRVMGGDNIVDSACYVSINTFQLDT